MKRLCFIGSGRTLPCQLVLAAFLALALAACGGGDDDEVAISGTEVPGGTGATVEVEIEPAPESESGVSGIASVIDSAEEDTTILLELDELTLQPVANLHLAGEDCLTPGALVAELETFEDGVSETTILDLRYADLRAAEHVVVIGESEDSPENIVACAEIPKD
ncbi:MAG: hypothetical protein WEB00_14820 [Dehalococcoidia bacterium]